MRRSRGHGRQAILLLLMGGGITLLSRCMQPGEEGVAGTEEGEKWVGSASCRNCHKTIYDSYLQTAHYHTSAPAVDSTIRGSFSPDSNSFSFNEHMEAAAEVKVVMEKRDSGCFQVAYINGIERRLQRFDIVTGSGRKAQTYLFWRGRQLLQLPISYFTATHGWANSPGYPANQVKFNRIVPSHCLECHSTYARVTPGSAPSIQPGQKGFQPELFDRDHIIYGVGCERCHGSGARHVTFHTGHPQERQGRYIVNPAHLGRQLKLDVCGDCHSGVRPGLRPPFTFEAGESLSRYFGPSPPVDTIHSEVHGNQTGLLAASKCFRNSPDMDCQTCHNLHRKEEEKISLASSRCLTCHQPGKTNYCKMTSLAGADLQANCVDCHMPVNASGAVRLYVPGQTSAVSLQVRTHRIAIYRNETEKIIALIKYQRHKK